MHYITRVIGALALSAGSCQALAQPIRVTLEHDFSNECVNGVATEVMRVASGEPIRLDMGAIRTMHPGLGFAFVRIDDMVGGNDIGHITVENNLSNDIVQILIADCAFPYFPQDPTDSEFGPAFTACTNWLGMSLGENVPDASKVRLAGIIGGNITGDVVVGEVFVLQAVGVNSVIQGDILAKGLPSLASVSSAEDLHFLREYNAISLVTAGNGITGDVIAEQGSIGRIFVGPRDDAAGIDGDIRAERGVIRIIESNGPVGANRAVSDRLQIRAGLGILQTFVGTQDQDGDLVTEKLDADIKADVLSALYGAYDEHFGSIADDDGAIYELRIAGTMTGSVDCRVIRDDGYPFGESFGLPSGIFVHGAMMAPVHASVGVLAAHIEAETFTQPITIDGYLKGIVWATGEEGVIPSISIGNDPIPELNAIKIGFLGSVHQPSWIPGIPEGLGEPESVVRASEIGSFVASRMQLSDKAYPPRIESPIIGSLTINQYVQGLVWSGIADPGESGTDLQPDRNDTLAYAAVLGDIDLGAVASDYENIPLGLPPAMSASFLSPSQQPQDQGSAGTADLWIGSFSTFKVRRVMDGGIHLPSLPYPKTVRIGCDFQDEDGFVVDADENPVFVYVGGLVDLRDDNSLDGYIMFHSTLAPDGSSLCDPTPPSFDDCMDTETAWRGQVWIGNEQGMPRVFSPEQTDPARNSPCYLTPSDSLYGLPDDLTGGALGVLPFHVNAADVRPTDSIGGTDASPGVILQSEFSRPHDNAATMRQGIRIGFYGPIEAPAQTNPVIVEWLMKESAPENPDSWMDFTNNCQIVLHREGTSGMHHILKVAGWEVTRPESMLPAGTWRVRNLPAEDPAHVYCHGMGELTNLAGPPPVTFEQWFTVAPDCDADGVVDSSSCDTTGGGCPADVDDGSATGTPDGGVTIDDLLYYLAIFQQGSPDADLDDGTSNGEHDGGVTIDDLLYFLYRFNGGC